MKMSPALDPESYQAQNRAEMVQKKVSLNVFCLFVCSPWWRSAA